MSADGESVVGHAGARLLSDLADATGLTGGLSAAMAPTKQRRRGHDRGHVLVDVAVMIADGGDATGGCDPVGMVEIAERLGVKQQTVAMWKYRGLLPAPRWTVSKLPAWDWPDILEWAHQREAQKARRTKQS